MNQVIIPKNELNKITLDQARNKPIFIVCKSTGKVMGMFSHHFEDSKNYIGGKWAASDGRGGFVGLHDTLDKCIKAADNYNKYIFVTNLNIKDFK